MKIKKSTVLSSVAASTAIATAEAGFLPGMEVAALIAAPTNTPFVGSCVVQTSADGTTWATAPGATAVTSAGVNIQSVVLAQFVRLNCTAFTSGSVQLTLLSDIC
jgi:hypothetical protein